MDIRIFADAFDAGEFTVVYPDGRTYRPANYDYDYDNFAVDGEYDSRVIFNTNVTLRVDNVDFKVESYSTSTYESWIVFTSEQGHVFAVATDASTSHGYHYVEGRPFKARLEPITTYRVVRDG